MSIIVTDKRYRATSPSILTLGNFDGVHLGHQRILKRVAKRAEQLGLPSVVYTFEPHPLKVVAPHKSPPLITNKEEKAVSIASFGIDHLVLARFTKEFAAKHPLEFMEDILVGKLNVREVWVGHDYTFGKGKTGTVEYLKSHGKELGFKVNVVPAYRKKGIIVSSSGVRRFIAGGKVEEAAGMLGRPYSISGRVIKGSARGKNLGFPTANIKTEKELIPKNGVYAVFVSLEGGEYKGVVNIGFAPTFSGNKWGIEVHIFDFKRGIYGKEITIKFIKNLREEKTFKNQNSLANQIKKDVKRATRCL
jgi:riboflavin kinase/FMN adenylyltransferase